MNWFKFRKIYIKISVLRYIRLYIRQTLLTVSISTYTSQTRRYDSKLGKTCAVVIILLINILKYFLEHITLQLKYLRTVTPKYRTPHYRSDWKSNPRPSDSLWGSTLDQWEHQRGQDNPLLNFIFVLKGSVEY